ncbi:MAG: winged helix-turn-helix domain-containing protein [Halobacteriota archaeon]
MNENTIRNIRAELLHSRGTVVQDAGADPVDVLIIKQLEKGALSVPELVRILRLSKSKIYWRISRLLAKGIVTQFTIAPKFIVYKLNNGSNECDA